jgi:hypothetical protein
MNYYLKLMRDYHADHNVIAALIFAARCLVKDLRSA